MARPGESREDIERALAELGWEVRTDDEDSGAVMGGHGKYHLMVSFEGEMSPPPCSSPTSARAVRSSAGNGRAQNACPPPVASSAGLAEGVGTSNTLLPKRAEGPRLSIPRR